MVVRLPAVVRRRSVRARDTGLTMPSADYSFVLNIAQFADELPQWGTTPAQRDRMLREFWPTEPVFASALGTTVQKYSAFACTLTGPPRVVNIVRNMLNSVEDGKGLNFFMKKFLLDLFTQDNGAFLELVRASNKPDSPVLTFNHLDSSRCTRTGNPEIPILYTDIMGRTHELSYYQVITNEEMPSSIETMRGMQYCVLSRILRAAQILRDISVYKKEKISGQFTRAIHLVSGVSVKQVNDTLEMHKNQAMVQGFKRYIQPAIIGSVDPTANVTAKTLELASLPDGFNEETAMRWYINQLALAFATDYQDYAPLPGGNLGTAQQSEVLNIKSRGKGPAGFMQMMEHAFNYEGILPRSVTFKYGEQDDSMNLDKAKAALTRAQERAARIASGELSAELARQLAADSGDLDNKYLEAIGEQNITPITTLSVY